MHNWVGTDNVKRTEFAENFLALDAAFHPTTGHKHSGAAGDGTKIPYANLTGVPEVVTLAHKSTHATGGSDAIAPGDIGAMPSGNGNGTDLFIGNRTADQALSTPGNTGTITQLLSWIAGRLKAITGKNSWYDAPVATIEGLNTTVTSHTSQLADYSSQAGGKGASLIGLMIVVISLLQPMLKEQCLNFLHLPIVVKQQLLVL